MNRQKGLKKACSGSFRAFGGSYHGSNTYLDWLLLVRGLLVVMLVLLLLAPSASASGPKETKKVLLIHSFEPFLPYSITVNQSIRSTLESDNTFFTDLYTEYLDLARYSDVDYPKRILDLLRHKYSKRSLDLIFVMMNPALDFLLKHIEELFPETPVVFCTAEKYLIEGRILRPNITGVLMEIDPKGTLEAALRLQPGTRKMVVIGGAHQYDKAYEATLLEAFKEYEGRLDITYLKDMSMGAMLESVRTLPKGTIVFYVTMFQDGTGRALLPGDVLTHIAHTSNAPVYGMFDSYLGHGIVGGNLVRFEEQGRIAAEMGLRILHGQKPVDLPVVTGPNAFMFDWRELKRWHMSEKNLPTQGIVLHKELTIWDEHKWKIIGVLIFCAVESLLITILLAQRVIRRRAEDALRQSERHIRQLVEDSPVAMVISSGAEQEIVLVNKKFTELFGYTAEDIPDINHWWPLAYPDERNRESIRTEWTRRVEQAVKHHSEIKPIEARVTCRDGSIRYVEALLSSMGDKNIVAFVDLTERKLAEKSLQKERDQAQVYLDVAGVMMVALNGQGSIMLINRKGCDILGYEEQEILGRNWFDLCLPQEAREKMTVVFDRLMTGEVAPVEYHESAILTKDGGQRIIAFHNTVLRDLSSQIVGVLSSGEDITQRRKLERLVLDISDMERLKIGQELHDNVGQQLTGIALISKSMAQILAKKLLPEAKDAERLTDLVNHAIAQVRSLAKGLVVVDLKAGGICSALEELAARTRIIYGISCEARFINQDIDIDNMAGAQLYRIGQEGVINAIKHGKAKHIEIHLSQVNNVTTLRIKDDGVGISNESKPDEGLGLHIMRYRAQMINSSLRIFRETPGGGTVVECVIGQGGT